MIAEGFSTADGAQPSAIMENRVGS